MTPAELRLLTQADANDYILSASDSAGFEAEKRLLACGYLTKTVIDAADRRRQINSAIDAYNANKDRAVLLGTLEDLYSVSIGQVAYQATPAGRAALARPDLPLPVHEGQPLRILIVEGAGEHSPDPEG